VKLEDPFHHLRPRTFHPAVGVSVFLVKNPIPRFEALTPPPKGTETRPNTSTFRPKAGGLIVASSQPSLLFARSVSASSNVIPQGYVIAQDMAIRP
jgi:hypothetical protein